MDGGVGNSQFKVSGNVGTDISVSIAQNLAEDTALALQSNFPPEQLPAFTIIEDSMRMGYTTLFELRCSESNELLSVSLIVDYSPRLRGEPQFLLSSFAVTPEATPEHIVSGETSSKKGRSKGYGTLLRTQAYEYLRRQKPNALGLLSEREALSLATSQHDREARRARWQTSVGLLKIQGLDYFIPPLMPSDRSVPDATPLSVAARPGETKPADLLLQRFDGKNFLEGRLLKSIVRRIYCAGYSIAIDDPFLVNALAKVDENATYQLG